MNILIVNPLETFATADVGHGFAHGFTQEGHTVFEFNTGEQLNAKLKLIHEFKKSRNLEIEFPIIDLAMEGFFDFIILHDIDVVFVIRGNIPPALYLEKLKKLGVTTILYNTEDPYEYNDTKNIVENYDMVFSNDQTGPELYKGCHYIPVAVDDSVYIAQDLKEKYYDLCFVGTFFKERVELFEFAYEYIKELKTYFSGHWVSSQVGALGQGYGKLGSDHKTSNVINLLGNRLGQVTRPNMLNSLYNKSKIVPCPHRNKEWIGNVDKEVANFSPRIFEAGITKTFQLVSGNREELIRGLFEKDEIVIYHSHQEFIDLMKYYLEHEDERNIIAEKASNKIKTEHTYRNRANQILQFLK
jgi:spore maturation protein CgeB